MLLICLVWYLPWLWFRISWATDFSCQISTMTASEAGWATDFSCLISIITLFQNQLGYWSFLSDIYLDFASESAGHLIFPVSYLLWLCFRSWLGYLFFQSDTYHDFASESAGLLPDKSGLASAKTFHACQCHNVSSKCELAYAWYLFHFQYDVYNIIVLQMSTGMLSDPLLRGQLSGCDSHLSQLSPADLPLGTYVMEKPQEHGDSTSELSSDETARHFSFSTVPEMAIIGWSCWLWAMWFVN